MPSKRKLKKDVNFITYELLAECFALQHFHPSLDENEFDSALRELVNKRNDLISRINHPVIQEGETLAQAYQKLRSELKDLIAAVEKISN